MPTNRLYKKKVLKVLEYAQIPLSVDAVRVKAGIKSWVTAKAVLLELIAKGRIVDIKTDKSWFDDQPKYILKHVRKDRRVTADNLVH